MYLGIARLMIEQVFKREKAVGIGRTIWLYSLITRPLWLNLNQLKKR